MFRFEHPEYLYALLLIPLLTGLGVLAIRQRSQILRQWGDTETLTRLMQGWSLSRLWTRWGILFLALSLLVIGWANPQWGTKRQKVNPKAADILLALDISQSMLAEDIAPNRMEVSKLFANQLLEALQGERIGLIIFAAGAYTQVPLTTDYGALELFIKSSSPDQAPYQGTEIGAAIDLADRLFEPESSNHKALILLTDGETHDEDALEKARTAHEKGMLIFPIAAGTEEGGFVPEWINGQKTYKKDQSGNPIRSTVNVDMLRQLASAGGGQFFGLDNPKRVVEQIRQAVDQLDRRELEARVFEEYESNFQYFLGAAFVLLLLEFFFPALRLKNENALNQNSR